MNQAMIESWKILGIGLIIAAIVLYIVFYKNLIGVKKWEKQ